MAPLLNAPVTTTHEDAATAAARFRTEGYLPLPGLLTEEGLTELRGEARRLEAIARRRDFDMRCMDGSPRHMTTLGGQDIATHSKLIPRLYADDGLRAAVSAAAGERVLAVPDPLERHVLNILHRPGDTHGAHTDDYPYALVIFLEAPSGADMGGLLEYVPRAAALADLDTHRCLTAHHRPKDAYLLRSDTTAHRVTPLAGPDARRTVLNFAYTNATTRPQGASARELYA
ncbi:hypothetical protein [Streptomyces sp. NPDC091268]|uniref:HalD/BesD family halogenase n=1 Tax=Streptomyces sp. NPDC091268 TaxID=3365979 RepID=UPI003818C62E